MDPENYVESRISSGELTYEQIVRLVRAFQLQNGLKIDGKPGPITFERVDDVLARIEPADGEPPNLAIDPGRWLHGIDIDHHQRVDERMLDTDLVEFAFVGVSEGTSGRSSMDIAFQSHLRKLVTAGVKALGVYHFARPSSTRSGPDFGKPLGEAQNFARQWELATKITGKMLPPVLDMEDEKERLSNEDLIAWVLEWCEHCEQLTGRRPIIYTYYAFIQAQLKGYANELSKFSLWLADYGSAPPKSPRDIKGWPWLFWQYTGEGSVGGITGRCDRNVFRGTKGQLEGMLL